jgi:NUMOD4 motif/HNH endonuclease
MVKYKSLEVGSKLFIKLQSRCKMTLNNNNTIPIDYTNEEWRDIPGWEGLYQVSDCGRVRSLDRFATDKNVRGKMLKQGTKKAGYKFVALWKNNTGRPHHTHRLVAAVFCKKKDGADQVNHKDGNKANNNADNLEWVTCAENHHHRMDKLGIYVRGSRHGISKLTEEDVIEIRRLYSTGKYTQRKLSTMFSTEFQNIHCIVRRKTWTHLD